MITRPEAASRLSYFLTRSLPDSRNCSGVPAESGWLASDRRGSAFSDGTAAETPTLSGLSRTSPDAWLNLREISSTNPDRQLFPEFDQFLQFSVVDETRSFLRELIDRNLSVVNVVKSDFAMLNSRLADHATALRASPARSCVRSGLPVPTVSAAGSARQAC